MTEGRKRNRRGVGTEGGSRRRRRKSWKERETGPGDRKGYFDFSNVGLCFTTTHCYRTSLGSGRAVTTHMAQALEKGSGTGSLGTAGVTSHGPPEVPTGAPKPWDTQQGREPQLGHAPEGEGHEGLGSPPALPSHIPPEHGVGSLKDQHMEFAPNFLPQEHLPFEGILRLCQNMRLRGAGFSLGWNRKPNQTSIRGMAGDPQEFLPGISTSDSHGEGVPAFPRCYPGLLSQDLLQSVPTTEPPSLLPWRNWLDAILRRAGWNSLQIAILSQSAAAPSNSVSRKSVIFFFFLPHLENERFCGKGLFWMHFSIWKKKIGHNDQSGLF